MLKVVKMVAVVLSLLVFRTTASATSPNFNWSPGSCLSSQTYSVNFVLHDFGAAALAGTVVNWTGTVNGSLVSGVSPYARTTGPVAHYEGPVTVPDGSVVWQITGATLTLPGVGTLQLANPNAPAVVVTCRPLGVVVEDWRVEGRLLLINTNFEVGSRFIRLLDGPTEAVQNHQVVQFQPAFPNGGAYSIFLPPSPNAGQWYKLQVEGMDGALWNSEPQQALRTAHDIDAPEVIFLSAACDPAREQVVLTWSADQVAGSFFTVTRNEVVIGFVPSRDPAADVQYTYRDPGAGGEYTVSDGQASAMISINCTSRRAR